MGLCVVAVAALGAACSGSAGPEGPPGANGATGATGEAGATGPTGPAGPQGDAGATGPTGPTGDGGATGDGGVTGDGGPTSDGGATGDAGPAPPPDGLILWLRSDTGVTLASDGSVASWKDLTGLGNRDAAPIFGLPGPLYVKSAYQGLPALRGDGTRSLFVNAGHGYPIGTASAVYLVMSPSTSNDAGIPTFEMESSQGRQYSVVQLTNGSVEWANATNASAVAGNGSLALDDGGVGDLFTFTSGPPSAGLHVFAETQLDGVSAHGYYDGQQVAAFVPKGPSVYLMGLMGGPGNAFTTGNNDPLGLTISAGFFNTTGDLVEVLQYDGANSETQVAAVQTYLAQRYGL